MILLAGLALSAGAGDPQGPAPTRPENAPPDETPSPSAASVRAEAPGPEAPWKLSDEFREKLAREADLYRAYALRFTCVETVRLAKYDGAGEASDEKVRGYAYLLEREGESQTLREFRQRLKEDGTPRGGEAKDEEPFPPAYAWVLLFSRFNQPYFLYRDLGDRFDGFDWVREVQFRGALPFTDGKDVRQWEGTVLVDAATWTPVEIRAEPSGQSARIRALFSRWSQAFNLVGLHLAPRPFVYRCQVQFRLRRDGLSFPTELRYDTLRAVSSKQTAPHQASIRRYDDYRFFKTATTEIPGEKVRE